MPHVSLGTGTRLQLGLAVLCLAGLAAVVSRTFRVSAQADAAPTVQHDIDASGVEHWVVSRSAGSRPRFFDNYSRITGIELSQDLLNLPFGRSIALLVGVSKYKNWDPLPGVLTTIDQLRDYLLGVGGFDEVFQVTDEHATPALIRDFMRRRFLRLQRNDRLLFYFGGHGTDVNGVTGYVLFPEASRSDIDDYSIPTNDIREWSSILPAKNVLFLLDSCSSGFGFTPMGAPSTDADILITLGDSRSRWIVTAGTGKQETFDIEEPKPPITVFGRSLMTALSKPRAQGPYSSFLTLDQVFTDLKLYEVGYANSTSQTLVPGKYPLQAEGDFLFINPTFAGNTAADLTAKLKGINPSTILPAPAVDDWHEVSITVAGQRRQGDSYTLDLGSLPTNGSGEVDLGMRNESAEDRTLTLKVEGRGLQAYFEGAGLSTVIKSRATATLKVSAKGTADGGPQGRIVAVADNKEVFDIKSAPSQVSPPTVLVERASGPKASGVKAAFSSPYRLCLGHAPPGYTLVKGSETFWLTGDRSCNVWSTCQWVTRTDADVCFVFSLQGHNENPFEDGVRPSEGHLKATYALAHSSPQLQVSSAK